MSAGTEARFEAYVAGLSSVLGHADRIAGLKDYCTGLMLPLERKARSLWRRRQRPIGYRLSISR